jgi:hypothetical protein
LPTYDPLEPRTNKSVYAFAASVRDQLAAVLAGNFAAGDGFQLIRLLPSSSPNTAGGGTVHFYDATATSRWSFRVNAASTFALDRYNGGNWFATLTADASGNVGIGNASPSAGGGQGVLCITNAAVVPTSNPSGGAIMYVQGGATKIRGASGTTTTIAPADPHCPVCGADFLSEFHNPRYGYVSICWFCLADELKDKPYVVRVQTVEHAASASERSPETIAAARSARLAEVDEVLG